MSRSINKIILVGNVGRDPDVQNTTAGRKVAHLSIATSRRVPQNGGFEDRTEWHRLTLWDRLAQPVRRGTDGIRLVREERRDHPHGGDHCARGCVSSRSDANRIRKTLKSPLESFASRSRRA
jgi:Single-strand binding protein family